ncbi:DNA polymerase [Streptomyces sp. NPDC002644]
MQTYRHYVKGEYVRIHVPENGADLNEFVEWFKGANNRGPIALDTETSGLDIYSPGYKLRTVQFGDARDAWVIHWERGGFFQYHARQALERGSRFLIHNASFDWLVLDKHAGIPLESLSGRTRDTSIMAKLLDPRQPQEGGIGSGLKPLSAHYVDPSAPDTQGDLTAIFNSMGLTKANGFARIDLRHPTYNLYAGLDVIYTARLFPHLERELAARDVRPMLVNYEHEIARICAVMQRTGMVLDDDYTRGLDDELAEEVERWSLIARRYGVENVNSTDQIAEAILAMGETLKDRTKTGKLKVDKAVLLAFADMSMQWERLHIRRPNPLAEAVLRAKRAGKWRTTYVSTFLDSVDESGRLHPMINTLAARTGRMSVQKPALQTLPSSDKMIRRALLADDGHVIVSCDFDAVELRVLAALADVKRMKEAIREGRDLHGFTAELVYGPNWTAKHRKICKGVGFGKVYGGGAATIARQTGADENDIRRAIAAYDRAYPEIRRFSNRHQRIARDNNMITVSLTGRILPLDRDRAYAVTNYQVQSAARDVLGQALINADERGLLPHLRLPVHDELVASAPRGEARDFARELEECMTMELGGVPITAGAEIGQRSWGSLYGADF